MSLPSTPTTTIPDDVECILATRTLNRRRQYLIKWLGFPSNKSNWVLASELKRCEEIKKDFTEARSRHEKMQTWRRRSVRQTSTPTPASRSRKQKKGKRTVPRRPGSAAQSEASSTGSVGSDQTPESKVLKMARTGDGELLLLVELHGNEFWMLREEVRRKAPQALIDYYEKCAVFD